MLSLIQRAFLHAGRMAFRSQSGSHTYRELLDSSSTIAAALMEGRADLMEERIAILLPAGMAYTEAMWGIWRAGGIAVPLSSAAKQGELEHVLRTAAVTRVIADEDLNPALRPAVERVGARLIARAQLQGNIDSFPSL